jgi:hypothetical protein
MNGFEKDLHGAPPSKQISIGAAKSSAKPSICESVCFVIDMQIESGAELFAEMQPMTLEALCS